MQNVKRFLDLFKDFELALRTRGTEPKLYEEAMDDHIMARLRMCRLFRNYLVHQKDSGFIDVTDKMLKWFEAAVDKARMEGDAVKKHMKALGAVSCTDKEKCADILPRFQKAGTDRLFVLGAKEPEGKDLCQYITLYGVAEALASSKAAKVSSVPHKPVKCKFMEPGDDVAEVPDTCHPVVVTADGTKDGKALGVAQWE